MWVDRSLNEPHHWLVAKLPMNLIREIKAGATITLRAWVVEVDGYLIGSFGLTVYDDAAAPRTFFGCCRGEEETADLQVVLAAGRFPLQFHNENFLPLLYAQCRIDPEPARAVIALLPSAVYPTEQGLKPSGLANDVVEGVLSGKADPRIKASCDLPVLFEQDQTIKVILAGIGEVNLTDADEGGELERLTFAAFDSLFPYGVFHRPDFDKGGTREKLCDVLAVSRMREADGEGIFVIQNKVASAFPDGLKCKTERRAKSIQKNIMHGIRQLKGAIDNLREGKTIYRTKGGTSIEVDPPMPQGSSLFQDAQSGEESTDLRCVSAKCLRDVGYAHGPQQADRRVSEGSHHFRTGTLADPARVLAHCDVTYVVRTILDRPMPPGPFEQLSRAGHRPRNTGDEVADLVRGLAVLDHLALDLSDLANTRPIQIIVQRRRRLQRATLDSTVSLVEGRRRVHGVIPDSLLPRGKKPLPRAELYPHLLIDRSTHSNQTCSYFP